MTTNTMAALATADPVIKDAVTKLFRDMTTDIGHGEATLALRAKLLKQIIELGFDALLPEPGAARDEWPDAACLLREQGRTANPIDTAVLLVLKNRELAMMPSPTPYQVSTADWVEPLSEIERAALGLARCLQACGAMQASLELSMTYVQDRRQFGRSLSKFQAIQHALAVAAEETAAASVITDLTLSRASVLGVGGHAIGGLLQAAALNVAQATTVCLQVCHQVHGAIGVTLEYPLHRHSLNLMRWRDEILQLLGSERACSMAVGEQVFASDSLWSFVTETMQSQQN